MSSHFWVKCNRFFDFNSSIRLIDKCSTFNVYLFTFVVSNEIINDWVSIILCCVMQWIYCGCEHVISFNETNHSIPFFFNLRLYIYANYLLVFNVKKYENQQKGKWILFRIASYKWISYFYLVIRSNKWIVELKIIYLHNFPTPTHIIILLEWIHDISFAWKRKIKYFTLLSRKSKWNIWNSAVKQNHYTEYMTCK